MIRLKPKTTEAQDNIVLLGASRTKRSIAYSISVPRLRKKLFKIFKDCLKPVEPTESSTTTTTTTTQPPSTTTTKPPSTTTTKPPSTTTTQPPSTTTIRPEGKLTYTLFYTPIKFVCKVSRLLLVLKQTHKSKLYSKMRQN